MELYKINPNYSLLLKKNHQLIYSFNGKINFFPVSENEVESVITIIKSEFFEKQNTEIFKKLLRKKILVRCCNVSSDRNTNSYLEAYTNSKIDMHVLNNKKVFIIGLGGVGCEVITHLVGNGIKKYVILDFDKVEDTNLNRQYLYIFDDISKEKTKLVTKKIKEKDPTTEVSQYNKFITNNEDVENIIKKEKVDMVICAADNPFLDIRISILKACINTETPCIFGGLNIATGQYGPTFIDTKKMTKYIKELTKVKEIVECSNVNKASFGPTNTIISAYISMDVIMTLVNRKKYINSLNRIKTINFISREDYEEKKF